MDIVKKGPTIVSPNKSDIFYNFRTQVDIYSFDKRKARCILFNLFRCPIRFSFLRTFGNWVFQIAIGLCFILLTLYTEASETEVFQGAAGGESSQFYKDSEHPLTQKFWGNGGISKRLQVLWSGLSEIKEAIVNYKINPSEVDESYLADCKERLRLDESDNLPIKKALKLFLEEEEASLKSVPCPQGMSFSKIKGGSGCDLVIVSQANHVLLAIKEFKNVDEGLRELLYSLLAFDLNPAPWQFKMSRIHDAFLLPVNRLYLVMEGANTHVIHHFLVTDLEAKFIRACNVMRACAEYLANFHVKNYQILISRVDRKKYLEHVALAFHSLRANPLKEHSYDKTPLSLEVGEQLLDEEVDIIDSSNIIKLLPKREQETFVQLVSGTYEQVKMNWERIFQAVSCEEESPIYFLTLTHGDAHGQNFFYSDDPQLMNFEELVPYESLQRVTMIDVGKVVRTFGGIGDPAEDVGRFLGSIWDWFFQTRHEIGEGCYERTRKLEDIFIETYLSLIKGYKLFEEERQTVFDKLFMENCNFYKLRFYRAVFNTQKDAAKRIDKKIKLQVLNSWVQENVGLDVPLQSLTLPPVHDLTRVWQSIPEHHNVISNLPDRVEAFIEARDASPDTQESYLTLLWRELQVTRSATLSSKASIAGMGGIGKTSLALEYAYEALEHRAYDVIYWLLSETESSLIKGYKSLLQNLRIRIKGVNDKSVIYHLVKERIPRVGKCLLIFDNVPDPKFLEGKLPPNTDILATSRCGQGWVKQPIVLDVFRCEDALRYVFAITGIEQNQTNIERVTRLVHELHFFPLALSHAAHYLRLTKEPIELYLEEFAAKPNFHFLQHHNSLASELEMTYGNLVNKTYSMSEGKISQLARILMQYMSYLDPDSIPKDVFLDSETPDFVSQDTVAIDKAFEELCSFSLIKSSQGCFSIHRLVQLVTRAEQERQSDSSPLIEFLSNFIKLMTEDGEKRWKRTFCFYDEYKSTIDSLTRLVPHAIQLADHSYRVGMRTSEVQDLYVRIGSFLNTRFRVEEAEYVLGRALSIAEARQQPYHILDWIKRNMINMHLQSGNVQALRDMDLIGLNDMTKGEVFNKLGKLELAEKFYRRNLASAERTACKFGSGYLGHLALTYRDLGEFYAQSDSSLALEFLTDALYLYCPQEGTEPDNNTASTLLSMAYVAKAMSDLELSLGYFERAFELFKVLYPLGNKEIAAGHKDYAIILHKVGRKKDAVRVLRAALEIAERHYQETEGTLFVEISVLMDQYTSEKSIDSLVCVPPIISSQRSIEERCSFMGSDSEERVCFHLGDLSSDQNIEEILSVSISETISRLNFSMEDSKQIQNFVGCELFHSMFSRQVPVWVTGSEGCKALYDEHKKLRIDVYDATYLVNRDRGVAPEEVENTADQLLEEDSKCENPKLNTLRDLKRRINQIEEELWQLIFTEGLWKIYLDKTFMPRLTQENWFFYIPMRYGEKPYGIIDAIAELNNIHLKIWKKVQGEDTLVLHYECLPSNLSPPTIVDIFHTNSLKKMRRLVREGK